MVLDAKAMGWASENEIDTAKLKAAKIPIYGKWYFPDIPSGELLVNLQNGQLQKFKSGLRAGEVLFVRREDLMRARLGPYARLEELQAAAAARRAAAGQPPAPEADAPPASTATSGTPETAADEFYDQSLREGEQIHLPSGSIFPLVLGLGLAITMLGLVVGSLPDWLWARIFITALGLLYLVAAGVGWALENHRAGSHEAGPESGHGPAQAAAE